MLTDEKKWLEEREKRRPLKFCHYCPHNSRVYHACGEFWDSHGGCPVRSKIDLRDAAEFEARVAAIMPYIVFRIVAEQAKQKDITIDSWECLKLARLAVEAEMEKEK